MEAADVAANPGPGYIISGGATVLFVAGLVVATLDDERHLTKPKD